MGYVLFMLLFNKLWLQLNSILDILQFTITELNQFTCIIFSIVSTIL